jgi:hypothetical protein
MRTHSLRRVRQPTLAPLFGDVLDRVQTEMPECYLPSAPGVLIAGPQMLQAAGPARSAGSLAGWSRGVTGSKKTARDGKTVLWVQRCGKYWIIERSIGVSGGYTQDQVRGPRSELHPVFNVT